VFCEVFFFFFFFFGVILHCFGTLLDHFIILGLFCVVFQNL